MLGQEVDDGFSGVCPTGAADLMKLRVQQLVQPLATAPYAGVVEFDFEGLEFLEEVCHGECGLCGLALVLRLSEGLGFTAHTTRSCVHLA